ncbi:protein C10 [Geospiza fortis]|uniref:Protein C10 n=1 Tax=Geospiza fortis TaxID=48883 RepID=A0A8N5HXJ3_GEOFO|nr:protein C10 [Geospiza fortis]
MPLMDLKRLPSLAGVLKFARLIKSYESQDPEIASMSGKLKAMFLPPMTLPPHGAGTGGVAAS